MDIATDKFRCIMLTCCLPLSALTFSGSAQEVICWGNGSYGQTNVPAGLSNVVAVAAGWFHTLALRADGTVVAWGDNYSGQTNVPAGLSNVIAISAGYAHSLALCADGKVVAWGYGANGQTNVPAELSNVVAISAGYYGNLALNSDGAITTWGTYPAPAGLSNVVAVSAAVSHNIALRANGVVAGWGRSAYGMTTAPSGLSNVIAIAASGDDEGTGHNLALKKDGTVVGWGWNGYGQVSIPPGLSNVVAVATAVGNSLALREDGTVISWGWDYYGQTTIPSDLSNVVAISSGVRHAVALRGLPAGSASPQLVTPRRLIGTVGWPFYDRVVAKNGAQSYGATGLPPGLTLSSITGIIEGIPTEAGHYAVALSATNEVGIATSTVSIFVNLPIPAIRSSGLVLTGIGMWFNYQVVADNTVASFDAVGLPPGLSIDAQNGVITGIPLVEGDFLTKLLGRNQFGIGAGFLTIQVSPVLGWGDGYFGQTAIPAAISGVVGISAGEAQSLALHADGMVTAWGRASVPGGLSNVIAVAAGYGLNGALQADGSVVTWGATNAPDGLSNVVAIAIGAHALALKNDGTVIGWVGWRGSHHGEISIPNGLTTAVGIAAGLEHSLALKEDGTVIGWGRNNYGQATIPADLTNVAAIAAGYHHSLALRSDGTVVAWGLNAAGQATVPSELAGVVSIAGGGHHSLALRSDGTVVGWGANNRGQVTVPGGLSNVIAIAAGYEHSLVLLRPVPLLRICRVSDRILKLAWPASISDGVLQETSLIDASSWMNVTNESIIEGGTRTVTITSLNTDRFFRLSTPSRLND